jgi:RsiW-degrading membrane proteinase PrsW (M82 family)
MFAGIVLGVLFVTPFVLTYVLLIRWVDRFEPEPWWLITLAFVWGAVFATSGGGASSAYVQNTVQHLLGASSSDPRLDAFGSTVLAPVFEEAFKAIGVALIAFLGLIGLKRLDGPLDGAIYGGVVGLGFTFTEDILYVAQQYAREGLGGFVVLLFLRTVLLGLSHCTFTACTGLGFGIAAESKSVAVKVLAPLFGFACAMAMHAMHNGLPTFFGDGGLVLMLLTSWLIDLLFFALLWVLVTRDRSIVIRELLGEVGTLIHPSELKLVSSYVTLGVRNARIFFALGFSAWRARRKKQLSLVELAFVKSRRRRGETGPAIDEQEQKLRHAIGEANRVGIRIGV